MQQQFFHLLIPKLVGVDLKLASRVVFAVGERIRYNVGSWCCAGGAPWEPERLISDARSVLFGQISTHGPGSPIARRYLHAPNIPTYTISRQDFATLPMSGESVPQQRHRMRALYNFIRHDAQNSTLFVLACIRSQASLILTETH